MSRVQTLSTPSAGSAPSADLGAGTVVAAAAAAAVASGAVLASLTYGWSYTIAALVGAAAASALTWAVWRRCPAERIADRGALLLAITLALVLFAVCAADVLDWRPLGIDDATAGLAVGFALLVAMPCRYALNRADVMPSAAGVTVIALVVALLAWAILLDDQPPARFDDAGEAVLVQLPARATAVLVGGLGYLYALRRGLYGTALILLVVVGAACTGTWTAGRMGTLAAVCAGALAIAAMLPALVLRRRADAGRPLVTPEPLLVPVAALGTAAFADGFHDAGLIVIAAGLAGWWFFLRRRARRAAGGEFVPVSGPQLLLRLGLAAGLAATLYVHALLIDATRSNYTGPMLLAELRSRGLYTVSDYTFARALVRDQYLWHDEVAAPVPVAAPSPERLIEAWRHGRDGWSTAMPLARDLRREALEARGYGFQLRADADGRLRVIDVVSGSSAHAAGVRRGDVLRAVDGVAAERLHAVPAGAARRLELVAPDGAVREVTVREARYPISSVAAEAVVKAGGRRVGYVALRHFTATTRQEFESAALRLRGLRVDDLVLDLRLNGGGSLHAAGEVASAIAGRRVDGRTFVRMVYNERHRDSDQESVFSAPAWGGLGLARLFVITSAETCSASEALVQGLAPYVEVVTIGGTTCGKPVGFHVVRYGDVSYWVVTFKDLNARGEGDYYGGLAPTCPAPDDAAHPLGDPADPGFRAALHYIQLGRCPPPGG
ncbi:MAG: S41 family peptidase [Burkholderiales bacterium]